MTYLLTENDWVEAYELDGWEVTRLDKSTWGPVLQAATDRQHRRFAHFPDLVIAQGEYVAFVDCAGGRPGFDDLTARLDKVVAHREMSEFFGIPVFHAWATGHIANVATVAEYGRRGEKNPNGYPGDGNPFLLVPIEHLTVDPRAVAILERNSISAQLERLP